MSSNKRNPVAVGRRSPISISVGSKHKSHHNAFTDTFSGLKPMSMARNGHSSPDRGGVSNGLEKRSSSVGKDEVRKINLMAIRKVDASVLGIVSTVPQVVLYQYQSSSVEWERTSTEGTLFIYSRDSMPSHGFVILNRLNSENMQSVVAPRMEFRVQHPFVLFKGKEGQIYGLCFQEEAICRETGDLLNSLSKQLSREMRNSSAPALEVSHRLDISELMSRDSTSRNYLGQTFSDGTSSPDSLTSEPISFIAGSATTSTPSQAPATSRDHTHHHQSTPKGQTGHIHSNKENSLPVKQKNVKGSGKNLRSTSPKNIPGAKKVSKKGDVVGSASPVKQRSHLSQPKQLSHSYASGQESHRGRVMHHAASFDQGRGYPINHESSSIHSQSPQKSGMSSQKGSAKAEKEVAPTQRTTRPFAVYDTLVNQVWPTMDQNQQDQSSLKEDNGNIVKQLFASDQPAVQQPSMAASTTMSVTLQNIFSQADVGSVTYSGPSLSQSMRPLGSTPKRPVPFKAVSLDEVEKKIVAEAPSPEVVNPPMVIGMTAGTAHSEAGENSNVLLKPSMFTSTVSSVEIGGKGVNSTATATIPLSNGEPAVSLTVQPPTPVVTQSQDFPLAASVLLQPQDFPSIPPVIHSPGMRAPPMSSASVSRGDPSSLASTRTQPVAVSAHQQQKHQQHVECGSRMPYRALSEPVMSAMASLATSQQHNPPMETVLEVSIPQRSTTAPPVSSALMSPQQFTQREREAGVRQESLNVLTKEQLQQSLIYMIQHDDVFVDKLYQAYQKSVRS